MAAGYLFGLVNRTLALNDSNIILQSGVAVSDYPRTNITDPTPWLPFKVTPISGTVGILFDLGTIVFGPSDTNKIINAIGIDAAHDGCTIEVRYSNTNDWATAAVAFGWPVTLSTGSGNARLLKAVDEVAARYWWVTFQGVGSPFVINNIGLIYAMDFGFPLKPELEDYQPFAEPLRTAGGYHMPGHMGDPTIVRTLTFRNSLKMSATKAFNREKHATSNFRKYLTIRDAWSQLRQLDLNSFSYTGVYPAAGGVPIFWHEGSVNGLSLAGRPAQYGFVSLRMSRNRERTVSQVDLVIRNCDPSAYDLAPAY